MNININGKNISQEDFLRMQEEQLRQQEEYESQINNIYNKYREKFNCNCAIVQLQEQPFGRIGVQINCSLDGAPITSIEMCNQCNARNTTDYTKECEIGN